MRARLVAMLLLLSLGCEEHMRPPPPTRFDAGPRMDAEVDAGRIPHDGGAAAPVVDGVIEAAEWAGAVEHHSATATDREGSTLTRLLARIENDRLYVGVEGTLADGDTMVLYVDRALNGSDGIVDLAALADETGALDRAISSPFETPFSFRTDFAWGTTTMPRTAVGLDEEMGWRQIDTAPDFHWITAEAAPSVCTATACEASIPLSTLGGTAPRTIAMFARIVHADGSFSNQTLPGDDPGAPGVVNALARIDDGTVVGDGGVPDGGFDGGPPASIVIDGQLDPATEWDGSARYEQFITAEGTFAGAYAETLYVIRDATALRIAIHAELGSSHALVMYVDHDVSGPDGLASVDTLDDFVGALDTALSKPLITPAELRIDAAWGTLDMGRTALVGDDRMGWRSLANASAYTNLAGDTVCGVDFCETEISLAELGVAAGAEVGLFVRLVSATSTAFSNQTLPLDDAFAPELVSVYASIPAP
ncbi:MAG: hypothetical protein KC619_07815 [Myxococcales bacterium]|nr:hypothetical protein [Myxococcales bacterium]